MTPTTLLMIALLTATLDAPKFPDHQAAQRALERMGEPAAAVLRLHEPTSPEVRYRLAAILWLCPAGPELLMPPDECPEDCPP